MQRAATRRLSLRSRVATFRAKDFFVVTCATVRVILGRRCGPEIRGMNIRLAAILGGTRTR